MGILHIMKLDYFNQFSLKDFYCNTFSQHLKNHYREITVPHRHDFFLTVIFTRGNGWHEIDFNKHPIQPGSVFMLNPGQTHHWELSADAEGYIFFHSQEFFDGQFSQLSVYNFPFFYSLMNPSAVLLNEKELAIISPYFERLHQANIHYGKMKKLKISALLHLIYVEICECYLKKNEVQDTMSHKYSRHLNEFEHLIEQYYKTEKSPGTYAGWLHMTPRHLNRITKTLLGKSPSGLITERVILEAKRLLFYSDEPIGEIAWTLGYDDKAYFSRLFRQMTGLSPRAFQQQYRKH